MYIYDPKVSAAQSLLKGWSISPPHAQHDRGIGGFGEYAGVSGSYWAHPALGESPAALSAKFLWPKKLIWGAKTFSSNIQSSFQRAIDAVSKDPAFNHLPDVRTIPIAIMALDASGARPVAGQREMEMFFSGSLLKAAAMYAAFQLRLAVNDLAATFDVKVIDTKPKLWQQLSNAFDKQIEASIPLIRGTPGITPAMMVPKYPTVFQAEIAGSAWKLKFKDGDDNFGGHLRKMIVDSHNDSAHFCIQALGYSWINGVLQAAGFLRFGFPGSEGIWLAADYDEQGRWPVVVIQSVNDDLVKQVTTCFDMARLFALLHDKSLVRNTVDFFTGRTGNEEMLDLLKFGVDGAAPSLLKSVPRSFTVTHSKIGVGPLKKPPQGGTASCRVPDRGCIFSEGAILKHPPSGRKFVTVWQNVLWDRPRAGVRRVAAIIQKTMDDYRP